MIDTRETYQDLFSIYWPIGLAVLVIVWVVTIAFVIRYRAAADRPRRKKSKSMVEEVYAGGLALIAATLVFFTFSAMSDNDADRDPQALVGPDLPPGAETVKVRTTAAKWRWRFDYPEWGITERGTDTNPARLVVPAGIPIEFEQTSLDVIHSFWVPELRYKKDAFPERLHRFALEFPEPGVYTGGKCAEYCGLRHSYMNFVVRVMEPAEFRTWVEQNRRKSE